MITLKKDTWNTSRRNKLNYKHVTCNSYKTVKIVTVKLRLYPRKTDKNIWGKAHFNGDSWNRLCRGERFSKHDFLLSEVDIPFRSSKSCISPISSNLEGNQYSYPLLVVANVLAIFPRLLLSRDTFYLYKARTIVFAIWMWINSYLNDACVYTCKKS